VASHDHAISSTPGPDRIATEDTESPEGGWGIAGHANTQADIATAARAALSSDA
jgi:hypothetical protein